MAVYRVYINEGSPVIDTYMGRPLQQVGHVQVATKGLVRMGALVAADTAARKRFAHEGFDTVQVNEGVISDGS